MDRQLLKLFLLIFAAGVAVFAQTAHAIAGECPVANASGKAGGKKVRETVVLETDPGSLNRTVNLGSDREEEVIALRVNVPKGLARTKLSNRMELVAEPFVKAHDTAESSSFTEISFSKLDVSGDGKRIGFKMCVDPPNGLDAGKYTSLVTLDGPPGVSSATMTVTVNGKDGGMFAFWAFVTAVLSFLVLLYKGAGELRAAAIAAAEKETDAAKKKAAIEAAEGWGDPLKRCIASLGWLVPTLVSIALAFTALWAAYNANPAWGEDGAWTSGLALLGTGLAAIGAKTILTPGSGTR